jgi:hypothetical protein
VEPAKVELIDVSDARSEASLRGHLSNDQVKEEKNSSAKGELSAENDYQLSRALDLIRALSIYDGVVAQKAS